MAIGSIVSPDVGRLVEAVAGRKGDPKEQRAVARDFLGYLTHYADRAALQTLVVGLSLQRERGRLPEAIAAMERGFANAQRSGHRELIELCGCTLIVAYTMNGQHVAAAELGGRFQGIPPEIPIVMGLNGLLDILSFLFRRGKNEARRTFRW